MTLGPERAARVAIWSQLFEEQAVHAAVLAVRLLSSRRHSLSRRPHAPGLFLRKLRNSCPPLVRILAYLAGSRFRADNRVVRIRLA